MNILIPMAGMGKRFKDMGYGIHKPVIPTTDIRTGRKCPMVVCATKDLPYVREDGSNVTYIGRDFHVLDGVDRQIYEYFPKARFLEVDHLTEGQACTCLVARKFIDNDEPLLIAGCDNGMVYDREKFDKLCEECDVLVFTFRHNEIACEKPDGLGWVIVDQDNNVEDLSIKKAISNNPMDDHAIVATFWFRKGSIFVEAAEKCIRENDRINDEFYVDRVIFHALQLGYRVKVFEIDRYIGWGTPTDYEYYERTLQYWREFSKKMDFPADCSSSKPVRR